MRPPFWPRSGSEVWSWHRLFGVTHTARVCVFLAALFTLLAPVPAQAQQRMFDVAASLDGSALGPHIAIFEDVRSSRRVEDVAAPATAAKFEATRFDSPAFGFRTSAYWVRLEVENTADVPKP